jgi:formylglycine-generating enzyme required for sulfatase activity
VAAAAADDPPVPADDRLPVPASWRDAQRFCRHFGYRLPTEAEWEFACLGGLPPDDAAFRDPARVASMAWIHANAGEGSRAVATRAPNALGLCDMLGNLWEWCSDWYAPGYAARPDPDVDPAGPPSGAGRVLRGGSWFTLPFPTPQCRTGDAEHVRSDFYGFRPAIDAPR